MSLDEGLEISEWTVEVGRIVGAHGIAGEVKVLPSSDVEGRFAPGARLCLVSANGERTATTVRASRPYRRGLLLRLSVCSDRTQAEKLRGCTLTVARSTAPPLPEGTYLVSDLIGMEVVTTEGRSLGEIVEVLRTGSNDVYETPAAMIPATREIVKAVDLEERKMTILAVPGLLDDE